MHCKQKAIRKNHHGNPRCPGVLLRRGLPPAIPRQEPERLLRPGRHRRFLPDRSRRGRLSRASTSTPCASTSGCGRRASSRRAAWRRRRSPAGRVKLNGDRVKAAHAVKPGDALLVRIAEFDWQHRGARPVGAARAGAAGAASLRRKRGQPGRAPEARRPAPLGHRAVARSSKAGPPSATGGYWRSSRAAKRIRPATCRRLGAHWRPAGPTPTGVGARPIRR